MFHYFVMLVTSYCHEYVRYPGALVMNIYLKGVEEIAK